MNAKPTINMNLLCTDPAAWYLQWQRLDDYERQQVVFPERVDYADCKGWDFSGIRINNVDFYNCNMQSIKMRRVALEDCTFHDCDLSHADFRGSNIFNTSFEGSNLACVNFDAANLSGANFRYASIEETFFFGAHNFHKTLSESFGTPYGAGHQLLSLSGDIPAKPIPYIRLIREYTGLGLKESKDLVDAQRTGSAIPVDVYAGNVDEFLEQLSHIAPLVQAQALGEWRPSYGTEPHFTDSGKSWTIRKLKPLNANVWNGSDEENYRALVAMNLQRVNPNLRKLDALGIVRKVECGYTHTVHVSREILHNPAYDSTREGALQDLAKQVELAYS